jgi:hypothetical protein
LPDFQIFSFKFKFLFSSIFLFFTFFQIFCVLDFFSRIYNSTMPRLSKDIQISSHFFIFFWILYFLQQDFTELKTWVTHSLTAVYRICNSKFLRKNEKYSLNWRRQQDFFWVNERFLSKIFLNKFLSKKSSNFFKAFDEKNSITLVCLSPFLSDSTV